jgi:hypothetical protein
MARKKDRDKDAESGLQILSVLSIIWAIGFFYWSGGRTILGIDAGELAFICCSSINILLIIIFLAAYLFTRKENRIKKFLNEHFKSHNSISVDELVTKFKMKRVYATRSLDLWLKSSGLEGDYDETTGLFVKTELPETSADSGKAPEIL